MDQVQSLPVEPPSGLLERPVSFLEQAFGHETPPYWAFLCALIDGLCAYEVRQGGGSGHEPSPLSAA
jgi:hypothetical protein